MFSNTKPKYREYDSSPFFAQRKRDAERQKEIDALPIKKPINFAREVQTEHYKLLVKLNDPAVDKTIRELSKRVTPAIFKDVNLARYKIILMAQGISTIITTLLETADKIKTTEFEKSLQEIRHSLAQLDNELDTFERQITFLNVPLSPAKEEAKVETKPEEKVEPNSVTSIASLKNTGYQAFKKFTSFFTSVSLLQSPLGLKETKKETHGTASTHPELIKLQNEALLTIDSYRDKFKSTNMLFQHINEKIDKFFVEITAVNCRDITINPKVAKADLLTIIEKFLVRYHGGKCGEELLSDFLTDYTSVCYSKEVPKFAHSMRR